MSTSIPHPAKHVNWPAVVTAALAVFMAQLDTTIVLVALPAIEHDLGVTTSVAEWVVLGYVVALIALSLMSGRVLDSGAHRQALTAGAAGFAAASIAAGLSPTAGVLIGARVVQGVAAALLLAAAPVIAFGAAGPEARGRAFGVISMVAPVGAVAGPVVGGLLVDAAGWPWIFFVNVPVAAVLVVLGRRHLAAGPRMRVPRTAWVVEAALLGGTALAMLVALSWAPSGGPWWGLTALAVLPLMLLWSRSATGAPVRRLLRSPAMAGAHVALTASYAALLLLQFLMPFYLHGTLGLSAAATGVTLLALPAASAIAGPVAGLLVDRWSARMVAATGAGVLAVAVLATAPLANGWQPLDLAWRLAAAGAGFGLFVTAVQTFAMQRAPENQRGTTAATTNLARQAGIALGPALGTAAWAASGYALAGLRAALVAAGALGAFAVLALTPSPPRRRTLVERTP
jgi:MFS family permease